MNENGFKRRAASPRLVGDRSWRLTSLMRDVFILKRPRRRFHGAPHSSELNVNLSFDSV